MTKTHRIGLSKIALSVAIALAAIPAMAQNTTSAVGGRITGADGKPAGGAQVSIVHKDSGSVNTTTTDAEGRYSAKGLRVGGPYTITITKDGVTEKRDGVYLQLAETASIDAKLGGATQSVETIVVTGQNLGSDKFSTTAMGAGTSVGRQELDAFPSIQRSLQDYARLDPRLAQTDKENSNISVSGQNFRYNKITIDGVTINDSFGLESNNLPTKKQPISIDVIQSVQVNISNYDVTQTGYTGGGINAVTKSGTNEFHGGLTVVGRNEQYQGQRYNRLTDVYSDPPKSKDSTVGLTLSGPIIKDKLFFLVNREEFKTTKGLPDFGPIGSSNGSFAAITPSAIASAQSIAQSRYGINIGALDTAGRELEVKDSLVKLDWNISNSHRASMRYTKTEQTEPFYGTFSASALSLNSYLYVQNKTIETLVGQWFADWTPNFSTEAKISQRDYNSVPKNSANLPAISLTFTGALPAGAPTSLPATRSLLFGTEPNRHFNVLDTKTLNGYFGANYSMGAHELKFAADYEDNKVYNAFLTNTKGNYTFSCQNSNATYTYSFGAITCSTATADQVQAAVLENFSRGRASAYTVQFPAQVGGSLDDGVAQFHLKNVGVALQDTYAVTSNLNFLFGARIDTPLVPRGPLRNTAAAAALIPGSVNGNVVTRQSGGFGLDNTNTIDGQKLIQPRFGFNYTFDGPRPMQVRGGFGLFQGAAASVWLSNAFSNTGIATRSVSCTGSAGTTACPVTDGLFNADPTKQTTTIAGSTAAAGVDYIENGLGQPSVWKANLAFDMELPWWGIVAGVEYLFTQVDTGLFYQQLNLGAPTRVGFDGRQFFYSPASLSSACWDSFGIRITGGATCAPAGSNTSARALNNPNYGNVTLLSRTRAGGGNAATVSLSGQILKQLNWSLAYTYTEAKEVSPVTSSIANSNFNSRAILNSNEQVVANSAYLQKDRINGTLNWSKAFFPGFKTTVGLVYEGRTGKPYSWVFGNDANGDTQSNDLMYVPKAPGSGEVVFVGDTATDKTNENRFWDVVNSNGSLRRAAGGTVKRNDSFAPWVNNIDMRISQEIPSFFKGHKASFAFDILNVGNLLNKKWGRIDEINFPGFRSFVDFAGIDSQGRYVYRVRPAVGDFTTRQAAGESQWAVQATFKYEF